MTTEPLQPPTPLLFPRDRTLRFRVQGPGALASRTWSVIAHKNTDDIYVGLRDRMRDMKLSLHRQTWRLALLGEAAQRLPPGVDRVLSRWSPTPTLAQGWQRAATIVVPTSSLAPEPPLPGRAKFSVWPAPKLGWGLRFDVLLGRPDREGLTVNEAAGEVGRLETTSGAVAWVVVTERPIDTGYEAVLQEIRQETASRAPSGLPAPRAWAWGNDDDDGGPVFFDLGEPGQQPL